MAAYDLEEQEQISQLKGWWDEYGRQATGLATVALLAVSGWHGWNWYKNRNASEASAIYAGVLKAGASGDAQKARENAGLLLEKYGSTTYAYLGALASGKVQAQSGEFKNGELQLQWVVEHGPSPAIKDIARLRLAAVKFDAGDNAGALAILSAQPVAELAAGFANLRGDIQLAEGKRDEARTSYRQALDALKAGSGGGTLSELVLVKLEALGGAQ